MFERVYRQMQLRTLGPGDGMAVGNSHLLLKAEAIFGFQGTRAVSLARFTLTHVQFCNCSMKRQFA